jgi:hypothetical protein
MDNRNVGKVCRKHNEELDVVKKKFSVNMENEYVKNVDCVTTLCNVKIRE